MLKKYLTIIALITIFSLECIGLIKINMVNTRALSPLGNADNNYELVSKEFGEDFSSFLKDNCKIKIYSENGIVIRIGEKDFKLTICE